MALRLLLHINEGLVAAVGASEGLPLVVGHMAGRAALLFPPTILQPHHTGLDKVIDEGNAMVLAAVVEHDHRIAVLDAARRGVGECS